MDKAFTGALAFLSNFFLCTIMYDGMKFTSNEAFFQAMKTQNKTVRKQFEGISPAAAKKLGRTIKLRPDWESIKLQVMEHGLRKKFDPATNIDLVIALVNTGNDELVESNYWHDNYWGSCTCSKCGNKGQNNLGKLLMKIRAGLVLNHTTRSTP